MSSRSSAFTLIELLIVVLIVGILSTSLALAYGNLREQTLFTAQKNAVVSMVEKARSLSLSNILVNGREPTEFYVLTFAGSSVSIEAHGTSEIETIESLEIDPKFSFESSLEIFYFPPYGDVCFVDETCTDASPNKSTTLSNLSRSYSAIFTIDGNGGYVMVD